MMSDVVISMLFPNTLYNARSLHVRAERGNDFHDRPPFPAINHLLTVSCDGAGHEFLARHGRPARDGRRARQEAEQAEAVAAWRAPGACADCWWAVVHRNPATRS